MRSSRSAQQTPPRFAALAGTCGYAAMNIVTPAAASRRDPSPSPQTMIRPLFYVAKRYQMDRVGQCACFSLFAASLEGLFAGIHLQHAFSFRGRCSLLPGAESGPTNFGAPHGALRRTKLR